MNQREASILLALFRHLDSSQLLDVADFLPDLHALVDAAGVALGGVLPVDLDEVADVLEQVEQRWDYYDDPDYNDPGDDWRDVETVPTGGLL